MEKIYYVTYTDQPTGEKAEKYAAHTSDTKLHAAFSCYIFNDKGQVLVTQRADTKKVWPTVWTNSCCGHPSPNETRIDAVNRRLMYELGMRAKKIELVLPRYIYKTPPYNGIIEYEFCPVYVALIDSDIVLNPDEVSAYKWLNWKEYEKQLEIDTNDYSDPLSSNAPKWSWWCKDQLVQLQTSAKFVEFLDRFTS